MGVVCFGYLLAHSCLLSSALAAVVSTLTSSPLFLLAAAAVVVISGLIVLFLALRGAAKQRQADRLRDRRRAKSTPIQPAKSQWGQPAKGQRSQPAINLRDAALWEAPQPPAARARWSQDQWDQPPLEQVPPRPSSGGLLPGTQLQRRYRIERALAAGGMGAVYQAYDLNLLHPCAVKEMLERFTSDEERQQGLTWFKREARMLLNLQHAAIPRIFDSFTEQDRHYLVMDLIEGRTLADVLKQEGQPRGLPEGRVRRWAIQLCGVLSYLHGQQPPVIFRDLKPQNIMVTGRDEIKLIDFGIARAFQEGTGTLVMTPGYAPLEQVGGNPEPRSDLYALGATLYQLLTLRNPRENKPTIFDFAPLSHLRPDISQEFAAILFKAVQREPRDRWASAAEMGHALQQIERRAGN